MFQQLSSFWHDENGWASAEWALVATILVLGAITGPMLQKQARLSLQEPAVESHVR
jgi:Flp pilus assembly pilin Flp